MMNNIEQKISEILAVAVNAPSGDNSQPWKFVINKDELSIYLVKEIDKTLYNFQEFGSLLSHGALVENIKVFSTTFGLKTNIDIAFDKNTNRTAKILFEDDSNQKEDPLAKAVSQRHTNRKPYRIETIDRGHVEALLNTSKVYDDVELSLVENLDKQKPLIKALSYNDELIFSNQQIHNTLFKTVNWSEEQDNQRVRGLYVKTMELNPDQVSAFKRMGDWAVMKKLKLLGIPKLIASSNQKLYQSSSALCLISIPEPTSDHFIRGGVVVERVWLKATQLGYDIQPVSGIPYLALRIKLGETSNLDSSEQKNILEADGTIRKVFGVGNKTIALVFRLGRGQPATAKSRKLLPEIVVK